MKRGTDWNRMKLRAMVVCLLSFLEEAEIDKLEEASYEYQIWKKGTGEGEKLTIAQSEEFSFKDTLEVVCDVPNDTWYFEIVPKAGCPGHRWHLGY